MKKGKGMDYMWLALTAFLGLGMEALLAFLIEPFIYGRPMQDWTTGESILHWILTCCIWGLFAWYVIRQARKQCGFELFEKTAPIKVWQWVLAAVFAAVCLISTWIDWGGSKVLQEFSRLGMPKFLFQYIYYLFEVALFMLIIVFGQKACEVWFGREQIPYGGILVALTWGLTHWGTKGSLATGLYSAFGGFCFGSVYLLLNRKAVPTYLALCIMFIV